MSMGMSAIDWAIVIALIGLLVGVLVFCQKYIKSTVDFLAANRCAGRYLLAITSGIAGMGAISVIANFERTYVSGFAATWWSFLSGPVGLIIAITGWVFYRLRETRCLTMAQFFEVRYSRNFRIFSGMMGWLSGILNYGIFPAVSVKFFIYFCGLPETFRIGSIPLELSTYAVLLFLAIGMGVCFAICGGQIAIMMTDFLQGIFCNVAFLVLLGFLLRHFSWNAIQESMATLAEANPGQSLFNPFETTRIKDFNVWFFMIGIVISIASSGTWQGSSGYTAAAKSPHEAKIANFMGTWRGLIQSTLLLFIPICAIAFFHHPTFATQAAEVEQMIGKLDPQYVTQARVPLFLAYILPTGLVGVFAAVMFAAMLSTDDTYMHSWGSILVQDVILPLLKKPLTPKQHMRLLRWSIVFVGIFAFCFSMLFKQTQYIHLFFAITGAIFTGGAGAVLIGGLYTKKGSTLGAWVAMTAGSFLALASIALQQTWTTLAPWMAKHCEGRLGQWFAENPDALPINSQVLALFITIAGWGLYLLFSFLERKVTGVKEFNLDKMLHRGQYDTAGEHRETWNAGKIWRLLGLTNEFSKFDRILFFASIGWTLLWFACFFVGLFGHFTNTISAFGWLRFWRFYILLGAVLGFATTIWFLVGGLVDIKDLFKTLATAERNLEDNGRVVNGKNAGEK